MTFTIRYNRATNHISGISEHVTGKGDERGGVVEYYAESACAALTRSGHNMAVGKSYENLADALADIEAVQDRKPCATCVKKGKAQVARELSAAQLTGEEPCDDSEHCGITELTDIVSENVPERCKVMPTHERMGIPAVGRLDMGPLGEKPACQQCIDHYATNIRRPRIRLSDATRVMESETARSVTVHAVDAVRGPVAIELDESTVRWLAVMLAPIREAWNEADDAESR
jgi:hypothetical protein